MHVSVTDAKAQLTDLVRRAEAGDDVILTRHGRAAVKLVPVERKISPDERDQLLRDLQAALRGKLRDEDVHHHYLYDENGLPA